MIGRNVIVDAVFHPWNLSPENQNPAARAQLDAVHASHTLAIDAANKRYELTPDEIFSDIDFDALAEAEFVESPVDLAVIHALPSLGFTTGNVTDPDRAAELRDRHPDRFRLYATVGTPLDRGAIDELKRQVDSYPVDGLKLYPALYYDNQATAWRLDGEDFATPLLEAAHGFGIRHVAIHKALWLEPAPRSAFDIDDMDSPLDRFADMSFEMVHGGAAFLEETIDLMQRHPNLYLTLESTFAYILVKPRVFAKVIGRLIKAVGSDRLLFASGNNLAHPAPLLKAFENFQFDPAHIDEFGIAPLTESDRTNILGANALRLHGLEPAAIIAATRDDDFARARAAGVPEPWSALRRQRETVA